MIRKRNGSKNEKSHTYFWKYESCASAHIKIAK